MYGVDAATEGATGTTITAAAVVAAEGTTPEYCRGARRCDTRQHRELQARVADAVEQPFMDEFSPTNPDLSKLRARGGKLILYHGWADPALSAFGTIG